jgi:hypothetical protein
VGDVWTATRKNRADAFDPPTRVVELSSKYLDGPTWLSPDGCRLYLLSDRASEGVYRIYVSARGK